LETLCLLSLASEDSSKLQLLQLGMWIKGHSPCILAAAQRRAHITEHSGQKVDITFGAMLWQDTFADWLGHVRTLAGSYKGLSGAIWTQLSDVEGEVNGIVSYDRKVGPSLKHGSKTVDLVGGMLGCDSN
jgi:hypothetical protein